MKMNRLILMVLLVSLTLMPAASAVTQVEKDVIKDRMSELNDSNYRMKFINNVMDQQGIDVIAINDQYSDEIYFFIKGDSRATITTAYTGVPYGTFTTNNNKIIDVLDLLETDKITAFRVYKAILLYYTISYLGLPIDLDSMLIDFIF